tara:strand:+ start:4120 stop:5535 length:1416 start_codon:yes stop_codon:yes gene_type:complete
MPRVKIPINSKPYKNIDSASLSKLSDELYNGYIDEGGSSIRFPGLQDFVDLGTGSNKFNQGIYWWDYKKIFIAVNDGRVFKITDKVGTFTEITGDKLGGNNRVVFTDNGSTLVMANGGKMVFTDGTTNTSFIGDTDAPTAVSHVSFLDQYILAIENETGKLWHSEVNDYSNWGALNFVSAESLPDKLVAMTAFYREIYLLGTQSTEVFYNDETTPFSRLSGGFTQRGCIAGNTLVRADNTLFWLDEDRRFVRLEGRTPKIMSTPFDKLISTFATVTDAVADDVTVEGKNFYIIHFPTEDETICYDYFLNSWSRLGNWVSKTGVFERWLGNSHAKSPDWGINLVGSRKDGQIYKLTSNSYTYDGNTIRFLRSTGNIDHDTSARKISYRITIRLRRGEGTATADPVIMIRYKDDGNLNWSNFLQGSLGKLGDNDFFVTFEPMGIYRTRQYEISVTDQVPFVLVSAEEDVEVED